MVDTFVFPTSCEMQALANEVRICRREVEETEAEQARADIGRKIDELQQKLATEIRDTAAKGGGIVTFYFDDHDFDEKSRISGIAGMFVIKTLQHNGFEVEVEDHTDAKTVRITI